MNEDGRLGEIEFMQAIYGKIARQTLECADFITHYSETKSACESNPLRRCLPDTQCRLFAQGEGLPRMSSQKLMPRSTTTTMFSKRSCSSFEIEPFVIPL
jgi:hypothetical protein